MGIYNSGPTHWQILLRNDPLNDYRLATNIIFLISQNIILQKQGLFVFMTLENVFLKGESFYNENRNTLQPFLIESPAFSKFGTFVDKTSRTYYIFIILNGLLRCPGSV